MLHFGALGDLRRRSSRVGSPRAPRPHSGRASPVARGTRDRRFVQGRPGRDVDRALVPPAPHLFGDEGQERREQPLQAPTARSRASRAPSAVGRASALAVGADLHEFDVVVAEGPEERLGALEGARVVVVLEGRRRTRRSDWPSSATRSRSSGSVTSATPGARRPRATEDELRGVEDLDREASTDLHLRFVDRGVGAGSARRRPVAQRVGAVLLEQRHRRRRRCRATCSSSCGRGRGPNPRSGRSLKGRLSCSKWLRTTVENSQVRMISWAWGRRSMGKTRSNRSVPQWPGDLGRQRTGGPGVHDVGVADEAVGLVALGLVVARGHVARRVDGQVGDRRPGSANRSRSRRWRRSGTRRGTARRRSAGARCSSRR